jgi:RHS repeat-associated protein
MQLVDHNAFGEASMIARLLLSQIRALVALALILLSQSVSAQTVEYIHTDALGTPTAVTNANRAVIERSEYEPYGKLLNRPLTDGPGFTGHVQDAVTSMTYMQQRYYDPGIGRFLSVDPVQANTNTGASFNRYVYVSNNPYKFIDPDGRQQRKLGQVIRAAWDSKGDPEKFEAQMEKYEREDRMILNGVAEMTAIGTVKDAIEITVKVANSEDATGQGAGAVAGEIAGQVTEKVLDGKIGGGAASTAGAAVGKAVGDTVEAVVDHSRGNNSPGGPAISPPKPREAPEPINLRDKR